MTGEGCHVRPDPSWGPTHPARGRDLVRFRALMSGLAVLEERGYIVSFEDFTAAVVRVETYRADNDRRART